MEAKSDDDRISGEVPTVGTIIEGRYRIVGELGAGGVGTVFRAEHLKLGHHVALKVLQPHLMMHPQFRPRFEREARALAALAHPHVVAWTDYSFTNGAPYLVMELLDGRPLRAAIAEGPMASKRVRAIMRQILGTLAYAHQLGFVHRDLKPDNIFLLDLPTEPDFVKLLDFGFVKLIEVEGGSPEQSQLTTSGMGIGTPSYMSPEQAWSDKTGPASDLYSLGIICYEMLTGQRPFRGEIASVVRQQMTEPIPEIAKGPLVANAELDEFLRRATEKRADDRFASATQMLAALEKLPEPLFVDARDVKRVSRSTIPTPPPKPRFSWPLVALAAIVGSVGTGALVYTYGKSKMAEAVVAPAPAPVEAEPVVVETPEPPVEPVVVAAPTPPVEATPPAEALGDNPFETRPRLPLLWNAHRQLLAGRTLSDGTEAAIERWGRGAPDDPRPELLLAANAVKRNQDGRAISLYRAAARTSPDARNDTRMLRNLVRLVGESRFQRAASEAVIAIYGPLAREAIDQELVRPELRPVAHARLVRLRGQLEPAAVDGAQ